MAHPSAACATLEAPVAADGSTLEPNPIGTCPTLPAGGALPRFKRLVKRGLKGLLSWETRNGLRQGYLPTKAFTRTDQSLLVRAVAWGMRLLRAIARQVVNVPRVCFDTCTGSIRAAFGEVRRQRREAEALLDRVRPDLLVFAEDNVEFETGVVIGAGHRRGIPSVVLPYTSGNAREAAESYYDQPDLQAGRFRNRLLSFFRPQWLHLHRGRWLVRLSAGRALVRHWAKVAPPLPWVLNSGQADAIALENEALLDSSLRAGLPRHQLVVTGSLRLDDLANSSDGATGRRRRLLWELGLPEQGRVLLCGLPPNQRPEARTGCEFGSYGELLDFWLATFSRLPDCNVLINPHPRCAPHEVERLRAQGVAVVTGDIAHLIPLCDVYVACVSATITMAVACGKPVVNYDAYHYHYDDFDGCPLVDTVHTRAEFPVSLASALAQAAEAEPHAYWGLVDGLAGKRLLTLFDALVAHEEVPQGAWQPHTSKVLRRRRTQGAFETSIAELVY